MGGKANKQDVILFAAAAHSIDVGENSTYDFSFPNMTTTFEFSTLLIWYHYTCIIYIQSIGNPIFDDHGCNGPCN